MRKPLAWLAGGLGLLALWRSLRRRPPEALPAPPGPDPADALRRTLAETRGESRTEEPPEPPAAPAPPSQASLDERRRRVHARAQEAIDAMREPPAAQ